MQHMADSQHVTDIAERVDALVHQFQNEAQQWAEQQQSLQQSFEHQRSNQDTTQRLLRQLKADQASQKTLYTQIATDHSKQNSELTTLKTALEKATEQIRMALLQLDCCSAVGLTYGLNYHQVELSVKTFQGNVEKITSDLVAAEFDILNKAFETALNTLFKAATDCIEGNVSLAQLMLVYERFKRVMVGLDEGDCETNPLQRIKQFQEVLLERLLPAVEVLPGNEAIASFADQFLSVVGNLLAFHEKCEGCLDNAPFDHYLILFRRECDALLVTCSEPIGQIIYSDITKICERTKEALVFIDTSCDEKTATEEGRIKKIAHLRWAFDFFDRAKQRYTESIKFNREAVGGLEAVDAWRSRFNVRGFKQLGYALSLLLELKENKSVEQKYFCDCVEEVKTKMEELTKVAKMEGTWIELFNCEKIDEMVAIILDKGSDTEKSLRKMLREHRDFVLDSLKIHQDAFCGRLDAFTRNNQNRLQAEKMLSSLKPGLGKLEQVKALKRSISCYRNEKPDALLKDDLKMLNGMEEALDAIIKRCMKEDKRFSELFCARIYLDLPPDLLSQFLIAIDLKKQMIESTLDSASTYSMEQIERNLGEFWESLEVDNKAKARALGALLDRIDSRLGKKNNNPWDMCEIIHQAGNALLNPAPLLEAKKLCQENKALFRRADQLETLAAMKDDFWGVFDENRGKYPPPNWCVYLSDGCSYSLRACGKGLILTGTFLASCCKLTVSYCKRRCKKDRELDHTQFDSTLALSAGQMEEEKEEISLSTSSLSGYPQPERRSTSIAAASKSF